MSPQEPSFAALGAPATIVDALARAGIHEPFEIQAAVLPDALAGRDILGRAPTGSGKTLAFGIPMVARMRPGSRRRPTALVLSPTRELAEQICSELAPLAAAEGHRVAAVYGGVGYGPQRRSLDGGASLLVACPGRLEDLLSMGAVRLDDVATVVVDEADRMADMGFLPAVRRILELCGPNPHLMLFSATLEGPVAKLTRDYQTDAVRHEVGSAEPDMTLARHLFWNVERTARVGETARFVAKAGPTIIFTRTRHGADRLAKQLAGYGAEAAAIHGGRSQAQRTRALKSFADGRVTALVATDVAARGIHVDGVAGVVHFDPPEDAATYVHRSGRTARAGATGVVLSLVEPAGRKTATTMQRSLGLPVGVTAVDLSAVVAPAERTATDSPAKRTTVDPPAEGSRVERTPADRTTAERSRVERTPADRTTAERHRAERTRAGRTRTERTPLERTPVESAAVERTTAERRPSAPRSHGGADELRGKVATYSGRRGFGFIKVKGRDDVFVHVSGVVGKPEEVLVKGTRVSFELTDGHRGPVAVNVRPLELSDSSRG